MDKILFELSFNILLLCYLNTRDATVNSWRRTQDSDTPSVLALPKR